MGRLKAIGLGAGAAVALAGGALADSAFSAAEQRAIAASGLPRASVVSVKPDVVVAIRNRGTVSQGGGVVEGVDLQGEVVSAQAAQMLGYRSLRSTVNIDCARRRDLVVKMTVFTEPGAKGVAINRHVPGGWVQPSPDAYLSDVIRAVCAALPREALAAPQPLDPSPGRATAAAARAPGADEDGPVRTSLDARVARTAAAPAPPVASTEPLRGTLPPPPPAQAPKAEPKPGPAPAPVRTPGKVAVQIAASATPAQAREALGKLRGKIAPPLGTDVRSVVVDGRTFHRALVTGFRTKAEAQAFCSALKGDCFVR
jgi:cell division septation protein DedD